jgi:hypothetical protein
MALMGNNAFNLIDISDIENSVTGIIKAGGILLHELVDQKEVSWNKMGPADAHARGVDVENSVNGYLRKATIERSSSFTEKPGFGGMPALSGNIDNIFKKGNTQYLYRFTFVNNNIKSVKELNSKKQK